MEIDAEKERRRRIRGRRERRGEEKKKKKEKWKGEYKETSYEMREERSVLIYLAKT